MASGERLSVSIFHRLIKAAPVVTITLGILDLALPFLLFDLSAKTPEGLPVLRAGFLAYRDAILLVEGTLAFTSLFGGIWAVTMVRNVSRIAREGREEAEAIQKARAREIRKAAPAPINRKSKKSRRR